MRNILALAAGIALIGGAAHAQPTAITDWRGAPHPAGSVVGPREDDPAYRRWEEQLRRDLAARRAETGESAATGVATEASGIAIYPPPRDWVAGAADWRKHVLACAQRYRTYNPETDTFYSRPGVVTRCKL